jgi:hypothetical protein
MNTKFSFMLFAMLIVLIVNACAPAITDATPVAIAIPPAEEQTSAIVPVTGNSASDTAREAQAPRLWSGEVFLSENDTPDIKIDANQDLQSACISEDSLTRRHGGCVE